MAYIVNTTETATAIAATYQVTLGPHQSGDLLLVCLSQDGGGTAIAPDATSATAGWAMIGTGAASQGCRGQWAYLIADSASEVNPVFTGANDDWVGTCIVIRDAHATAPFGATPTSGTDFVKSDWGNSTNINYADSGSLTSAVDECLLIYSWCSDGAATANIMRSKINEITALDKYSSTAIGHIIGCRQQQSAGAAPTVRMYSPVATEGGTGWILAVRNKTGGALQPDIRPDVTEIKWYGSWATQHDAVTWQSPDNFTASTINGIATSTQAPTIGNVTTNTNTPWGAGTSIEVTDAGPAWVGGTHTISSTDVTGKVISFQWDRNAASSTAAQGAEGIIVGFSDGTNWVTYQVSKPLKGWLNGVAEASFIAPGVSTEYANSDGDSSSSINWAAVTRVGYFWHKIAASTTAINVRHLTLSGTTALTGGGSSRPATFNDYQSALVSWQHYRSAEVQASAQILAKSSVQIGDGTNKTYFDGAAQSFEFPQAWSASSVANWQMSWNALENAVSFSVKAGASDTVNLASGVSSTDTAQNLSINASSNTGATYSFAQSFVGWRDPIDNAGLGWVGSTFKQCGTVTIAGGGDMTNCSISKTTSTNAALAITANGSTLDGCTIEGTGAAYALELGTAVTAITLTDCTIAAGSLTPFDKVHVLDSNGAHTVTITISGTTSLAAGDVTSAGATVVISAPQLYQVVVVSGFTAGSRIQIYDTTSSTELFNGTASAGNTVVSGTTATWTDPTAAVSTRAIRVRVAYVNGATAKNFIETSGLTCGVTSGTESITYPVTPTADTTYNSNAVDGSTVTGITFTDAATDLVNINIAADTTPLKDIYAAFVYWLFTAAGIDDDVAYIDAPDTANYIMTSMKFRNTSTDPLKITGGYFYDSTGSVENCVDVSGSSGNIYPMPEHVVPFQTTGTYAITGDIADIPGYVAGTAVDGATTLAESLRLANSVLGGKVSGAGTGTETFRDLADTKDRVVATVDSSGNRTVVTRTLT